MARTTITKTVLLGSYPALPLGATTANLNLQAATGSSGANGNQIPFDSGSQMVVVAQNTSGVALTVTFTSLADPFNRTGDISAYSIGAGLVATFIFARNGWCQSDGNLYCEASANTVKFAAFNV